eukprot:1188879-Rhodomonas_salina.1
MYTCGVRETKGICTVCPDSKRRLQVPPSFRSTDPENIFDDMPGQGLGSHCHTTQIARWTLAAFAWCCARPTVFWR